jgi:hypothetical protein
MRCGHQYREIVQARRAYGRCSQQNRSEIQQLRRRLPLECHRKQTRLRAARIPPALDLLCMPRELLPSVETVCSSSPEMWPYVKQPTVDAVKAMMLVHCTGEYEHHAQLQSAWHTLEVRKKQYAKTGAGSVAEAIVYNGLYWRGELEHDDSLWLQCKQSPAGSSTASLVPPEKPAALEQCTVM